MSILLSLIILILQLGDWLTTRTILKRGGVELNPIAKWGMDKIGIDQYLGLKTILIAIPCIFVPIWFNCLAIALYGAVVFHNWRELNR